MIPPEGRFVYHNLLVYMDTNANYIYILTHSNPHNFSIYLFSQFCEFKKLHGKQLTHHQLLHSGPNLRFNTNVLAFGISQYQVALLVLHTYSCCCHYGCLWHQTFCLHPFYVGNTKGCFFLLRFGQSITITGWWSSWR